MKQDPRIIAAYWQHLSIMDVIGVDLTTWDSTPKLTTRESQIFSWKVKDAIDRATAVGGAKLLRKGGVNTSN